MAHFVRERKVHPKQDTALPERLGESAVLLDLLRQKGVLQELGRQCKIQRQGGFAGIDVVLFLLVFFTSGFRTGIRPFYDETKLFWRKLAALAGRSRFPSPPALSRALNSADSTALRPFQRWLLTEALDLRPLLQHPAAKTRDATGKNWHVFHFDPTMSALRQRALPPREGFPEPERRAQALGKPGRAGRKRGEIVFSRTALQHAATGLWLHMEVEAGQGNTRDQLRSAIDTVVHLCTLLEHSPEDAVTCLDGQWGGIPSITTFFERNTRFITRCSRYHLLQEEAICLALNQASWWNIPDSAGGPLRSCADAGWVWLEPSPDTRQEDGSAYAPRRVRLVVSRYPLGEGQETSRRGHIIDGAVYELFMTNLDEEGWPPSSICATYFGRCGQENQFACEARELHLDRIFAYHPDGQELAAVVGAFVWNWRTLAGFLSHLPAISDLPPQLPLTERNDRRRFADLPYTPAPPKDESSEPPVEEDVSPKAPPRVDPEARRTFRKETQQLITRHLPTLFANSHLERRGWLLDKHRGMLLCPNQLFFQWSNSTNNKKGTSPQLVFRTNAPLGSCAACPLVSSCRKHSPQAAVNFTAILVLPTALWVQTKAPPELRSRSGQKRPPKPPLCVPASTRYGSLAVTPSALLPAKIRHSSRPWVTSIRCQVDIHSGAAPSKPHPFLAPTPRHRSHGRSSWEQKAARYLLPRDARIHITFQCSDSSLATLAVMEKLLNASARRSSDPAL